METALVWFLLTFENSAFNAHRIGTYPTEAECQHGAWLSAKVGAFCIQGYQSVPKDWSPGMTIAPKPPLR